MKMLLKIWTAIKKEPLLTLGLLLFFWHSLMLSLSIFKNYPTSAVVYLNMVKSAGCVLITIGWLKRARKNKNIADKLFACAFFILAIIVMFYPPSYYSIM